MFVVTDLEQQTRRNNLKALQTFNWKSPLTKKLKIKSLKRSLLILIEIENRRQNVINFDQTMSAKKGYEW